MKFILHYLKYYKRWVLVNILSVFGFALVELGLPTVVANMLDNGVAKGDTAYLYRMGVVMLIISVLGAGGTILLGYCCARISTSVTRDIRNDIFKKAQSFSHVQFQEFGISSMITRTNNDAFQIQMFVNVLLRTALMTPIMLIISFVMTFRTSVKLSLIILATIPVITIGVILVAKVSGPLSDRQQASLDHLNRISRENLNGIRVIRSFGNDTYEQKRFEGENEDYTGYSKKIFKLMMVTQPFFFFLMNLAALAIFWTASSLIQNSAIRIGQLTAFMEYLFHAMFSFMLFCTVFMMYPRAAVSARRIKAVLDSDNPIENCETGKKLEEQISSIEFDHVTFVYPDGEEAVIKDLSFQIKGGQKAAFIGSTGSGKSTLINLLPRFYDVTEGSIRINGTDIRDYDINSLRDAIGFIPQKAMLFTGTIAENICYGKKDASMEEMISAAKTAQAYDFIQEKGGFEQIVTESAGNLSGGQKQRLCITRALVRKPKVYVFDDSFSALDFKTDAMLRKALKEETKESITLVVAQRISSIMDADQIVVLNEGVVAGIGTHKQLMKDCPIYREIAASQLSEEELANA